MATIETVVSFFLDLGPSVFLPIVILTLALILGAPFGKSLRAALTIGVAFVGINLILGLLVETIGPAARAMVERFGIDLQIIDVGWPAAAAIAFGSDIAALTIPAVILLNMVLLIARVTRTINFDIWNYWHFAFVGALVQTITGEIWLGLVSALLFAAVILFIADWTAPAVQKLMHMPGISLPHGFSAAFVIPAILVNRVIDMVPGLNRAQTDAEAIRGRFGVIGEPVLQGFAIGAVIALIAYGGTASVGTWITEVLQVGVTLAGVMVLMPRMVSLLMEGLIPLSEAVRAFLNKRAGRRDLYIGLDAAIAIGHPTAIATSLLMVPITLALAVVLPGNRVLPFGDLATIPFMVALMIPIVRGNVVRATITSTIVMVPTLYLMNAIAPIHTEAAVAAGFTLPAGATTITSMVDGGSWLAGLFTLAAGNFWVGHAAIFLALSLAWILFRRNPQTWHRLAGADRDAEETP